MIVDNGFILTHRWRVIDPLIALHIHFYLFIDSGIDFIVMIIIYAWD